MILPSYHLTILPSYQLTILPSYHLTILPSYHLTISLKTCNVSTVDSTLYNAMIQPYTIGPMGLTGFTWYQVSW